MKRLLVIEGNEPGVRLAIQALVGLDSGESYRATLRSLSPHSIVDIADPSDPTWRLPAGVSLQDYQGVVMTGSALNVYDGGPVIERQLAFVKSVFAAGVSFFGSCWGLQVAVVAAGGVVLRHSRQREFGFARRIALTMAGQSHQMFKTKPAVFEAPTVHVDHVVALPQHALVLAENDHSIQALSFRAGHSRVWGVQYHPEYSYKDIAAVAKRYQSRLLDDHTFESLDQFEQWVSEIEQLEHSPDERSLVFKHGLGECMTTPQKRLLELHNWLESI